RTASLLDLAHEAVDLSRLRQVDLARLERAAALGPRPRLQRRQLAFQEVAGPHPGAAVDEALDYAATDPARGTGDDDRLVVEMDVHQPFTPPLARASAAGTQPPPARRRAAPRCRRRGDDAPEFLPVRQESASSCSGANGRAGWPAPRSGRHSWRWSIRARRLHAGR